MSILHANLPFLPTLPTLDHLYNSYTALTQHIVPGPASLSYFLPLLILPAALLVPPHILTHRQLGLLVLPVIYACLAHAWCCIGGGDVISVNVALWSTVLIGLKDVRRQFVWVGVGREGRVDGDGKREGKEGGKDGGLAVSGQRYPDAWMERIPWVLTLLVSLRFTGWRIGDAKHDEQQPPKAMGRWEYSKHVVPIVALCYALLDATSCYVKTDPFFVTSGIGVDAPLPPSARDMPSLLVLFRLLPPRLARSSVLATQVYAMVAGMFYLPVLPVVALNAVGVISDEWSPHTWPPFFGDFRTVADRGLRGLWGSWWHQINRQLIEKPGRALAHALCLSTLSSLGYGCMVATAFFFSGIMHMGLVPPKLRSEALTANEMRLYVGGFFWSQVPAFAVEVVVSKLFARFAPHVPQWSVAKIVILAWTAAWLCFTLPLLAVPFREIGYWTMFPLPFSVFQGLAGQGWRTW